MRLATVCQVVGRFVNPACEYRESGGYLCERVDPHTGSNGHAFGAHTIQHARMGNGWACSAIDPPLGNASPFPGQMLAVADFDESGNYEGETRKLTLDTTEGNVITSIMDDGSGHHRPVLDLDLRAILLPSTTPDHHHLFIDKPMTWDAYCMVLTALAEVGVIERGYLEASITRGHTAVRLPWIKK